MSAPRKEVLAEGVELWLGDCREVLPMIGQVDATITDPPYSELVHSTRGRRGGDLRTDGGPKLDRIEFSSIDATQAEVAAAVCAVTKGWFICFSDIFAIPAWRERVIESGGKSKSVCLWIKPDCAPQFNGQKPATAFECIAVFWVGPGVSRWNGGGARGLYTHNTNQPTRDGRHPTEKPIPLMCELVDLFTTPNGVICDPFAGSGTTGVAAVKRGRRFIGVEREPKYFQIACERISDALRRPEMFVARPAPAKQEAFL